MKLSFVFLLFIGMLNISAQAAGADEETNRLGNKGLELIQKGNWDEGLALMKKATTAAPEDASWHMNYGSMLMMRAQKSGGEEVTRLCKESEAELKKAVGLLTGEKDNILRAQCYFLIGDIYFYPYQKPVEAKPYYEKALKEYPGHGGAMQAMARYEA